MQLFESIERIRNLHFMIKNEYSGTPTEFARSLGLSKRQLYNVLNEIKSLGADIGYNKVKGTYYYKNGFDIELIFKVICAE